MSAAMRWLKRLNWGRHVRVAALTVFTYQFIEWLAYSWWPETVRAVQLTLLAAAAVEIVCARLHRSLRLLLHAAFLLAITGRVMEYRAVAVSRHTLRQFAATLWDNFSQLMPVVWFAAGACVVLLLLIAVINDRGRVLSLIVCSVILLAAVDSFSLLKLWDNVAVIILCGLALLIAEHADYMKNRHPASWSYILEYPGVVIGTMAILGALVIMAAMLAPNARPLMTDPYTAWRASRGEATPTLGKGFASVVLPTAYKSGYERNSEQLGGAFDFDYSPIMTVQTDHRSYWRGQVKTRYTGQGWVNDDARDGDAVSPVAPGSELQASGQPQLQGEEMAENKQTVTILSKESFPVLFGAYPIAQVVSVGGGEGAGDSAAFSNLRWSSAHAELRWNEAARKEYPKTYTLISELPVIDEDKLRAAQPDFPADRWAEYLQLPRALPPRVAQLAEQITASATSEYDKVKAIESYLHDNYAYNNKPDVSKATSDDFVDSFLFEIKEGYCDYYSTAMAVLVRTLGIPSRWVKGYSTGSLPVDDDFYGQMSPQELQQIDGGEYTVRNSDAHSWVEVYFPGSGWIPFEPTAGFTMPLVEKQQQPEPLPDISVPTVEEPLVHSRGWLLPAGISAAAVLLCLLLAWLLNRRFGLWARGLERWERLRRLSARQKLAGDLNRLLRHLRKKGYARHEYETLREAVNRWCGANGGLADDFRLLLHMFEKIRYSRTGVDEREAAEFFGLMKKIREAL